MTPEQRRGESVRHPRPAATKRTGNSAGGTVDYLNWTPQEPHKFAKILAQKFERLQAMGRYEGGSCHAASLPFARSILAIGEKREENKSDQNWFWQNEAK